MALINIESLTRPLEGENPCGENLRWDRAYLELERLAEGSEERQVGTTVIAAEEPDWREIRDKCVELLGRGRHLRLGVLLTVAAVRLEGYAGLRDGLKVIEVWLTQYWDTVWPVLDAEDNNDPTERVNAIGAIATPMATYGDKTRLLDRVYDCPICESRQLGKFSLRDVAVAAGTLKEAGGGSAQPGQEGAEKITISMIDGAFAETAETDRDRLEAIAQAAEEASASLDVISSAFSEKCGPGIGPDVMHLKTILKDASTAIRRRLSPDGSGSEQTTIETVEVTESGETVVVRRAGLSGEVTSRDEAVAALEKVIKYFEETEPSSPVPYVATLAKLMIGRDFRAITRVLPPDVVQVIDTATSNAQS
ncbi:MAG: type VI secretion system protein TssA [Planctomycetota bacterium]|nr:type VI secretion system protein TssA [Planctomycetota bacterium]